MEEDYERNTGLVIVGDLPPAGTGSVHVPEPFAATTPLHMGQGRGTGGYHAVVLEEVAKMAVYTTQIAPDAQPAPQYVLDKHFLRKHGPNAYYGQKKD